MASNSVTPALLLAALAAPALGSEATDVARRLLDLSPERVAAFEQALHDFSGVSDPSSAAEMYFRETYQTVSHDIPSCLRDDPSGIGEVRVAPNRDVVFIENLLIEGREDDYERTSRRWLERSFKGSDAAALAAGRDHRWQPRASWNDGPVGGFRRGMTTMMIGMNGDWRIRLTRPMKRLPGWSWRTWVGERDGEDIAGLTIGRSLYASVKPREPSRSR